MAFWAVLAAAGKAAAQAAAKAAAAAGKAAIAAAKPIASAAAKGATAIGHGAMELGKGAMQGITNNAPAIGNVGTKATDVLAQGAKAGVNAGTSTLTKVGQGLGKTMNQMGRQLAQNVANKTPFGGDGGVDFTGGGFSGPSVETAGKARPSLGGNLMNKMGSLMENPLSQNESTTTEPENIVAPQISGESAVAPTTGSAPLSKLSPEDIAYLMRLRQQGGA